MNITDTNTHTDNTDNMDTALLIPGIGRTLITTFVLNSISISIHAEFSLISS